MRLNTDIVQLHTHSGVLMIGFQAAFGLEVGLGEVIGAEEVRRLLLHEIHDRAPLDALRRFWSHWHSDGHGTNAFRDRSIIDRVAHLAEKGPLCAYFVPDQSVVTRSPAPQGIVKPSPAKTSTQALRSTDFESAARQLQCENAAIQAVAETETKRDAFDEHGRPTILFERHKFHEFTSGKFDAIVPDLSNKDPGGYGKYKAQYGRFDRACALDADAAKRSCSWGMFQIMGFNYRQAGFGTVDEFVDAMRKSVQNHLKAFVNFIKADGHLLKAIQKKDWPTFARLYNGRDYKKNNYDTKMRENYERLSKEAKTS